HPLVTNEVETENPAVEVDCRVQVRGEDLAPQTCRHGLTITSVAHPRKRQPEPETIVTRGAAARSRPGRGRRRTSPRTAWTSPGPGPPGHRPLGRVPVPAYRQPPEVSRAGRRCRA